jgi:hypothetical protein
VVLINFATAVIKENVATVLKGLLKAKPPGWYPGGHNKLLRYYPSFWEGIFIFW